MSADDYLDIPGCPGVRVALLGCRSYRRNHKGELVFGFAYVGTAEALIAARVATEQMLERAGSRARRLDESGDGYRIDRWQASRDGHPYPRFRVIRWKRAEAAMRLPGARESMAARGLTEITSPLNMLSPAIGTPASRVNSLVVTRPPTADVVYFDSWTRRRG